jgi:glucosylceramidase
VSAAANPSAAPLPLLVQREAARLTWWCSKLRPAGLGNYAGLRVRVPVAGMNAAPASQRGLESELNRLAGAGALFAITGALALTCATPADARTTSARPVSVTVTSANLRRALSPMPALGFGPLNPRVRTIRVDDGTRYQRVLGFGAAMTDSSAWLLWDELLARQRTAMMADLFASNGIGLNYVRAPIGASDFTANGVPYSYDDMPAGQTDPGLAHFSIAHDEAYILPALRAMLRLNSRIDVLATAWSVPGWMKANDALDNPTWGAGEVLPAAEPIAAEYYVRFLQAYAQAGVPVTAITPGDELGWTTEYPGMALDDEPGFITGQLIPALRGTGLGTRVYDFDGSDFAWETQYLAAHASYRVAIAGSAVHCYAGLKQMSELHAANPGGSLIESECSPGIVNYPTAEIVIASLRNWSQAVELWNVALDPQGGPKQQVPGCTGCAGLVTVDESTHRAALNANYYQLGQVSKFVRRGAVRIASDRWVSDFASDTKLDYGVTPGLDNVALRNPDGSKVLVAYDNSSRPIRFQVAWRGRAFTYTLGSGGTVTFTWR